ncbi:MAG: lipoyl synthase [Bacteroidales bacterium]|nr:lipoyl synthase [Bacteroidales bacterium]
MHTKYKEYKRLPRWMKMEMPKGENYSKMKNRLNQHNLHTICTSGKCPNIGECWNRGTATFMILGEICTRSCKFCGVQTGKPAAPDYGEPERVAETIRIMDINHAVLTSVDRDDLSDRGAGIWAETIRKIREKNPGITMEALIPDFDGNPDLIDQIIDAGPEVISHNLETVERLTPKIRTKAKYHRSLKVIRHIASSGIIAKSGIMAGLGETEDEIYKTMDDLIEAGCKVFTIGQYLQPTVDHLPVDRFIEPEKFNTFKNKGLEKGFSFVESHPLVRSSYHADKHVNA